MTIPNTIPQLGGRFYKAPMKVADQADVSAHASRMLDETARLRLEQNII
jgi:hypothetical protein